MRLGRLESLRIRGFRSLADVEIEDLPDVAVLIGANGSGKSNLISFFEMISRMLHAHGLAESSNVMAAPTINCSAGQRSRRA